MERPLPRRRAPLLARRRAACAANSRPASPARAMCSPHAHAPVQERQLRRRARRLHARRSRRLRPQAQRGERRGQSRRLQRQFLLEPRRRGAERRSRRSSRRARATCAICWRCCSSSRGTPMLAMGAELGHSQGGNNNAYAQDNAISWIDWSKADAGADRLRRPARSRCAAPIPRCRAPPGSTGAPIRRRRPARRRMARRAKAR